MIRKKISKLLVGIAIAMAFSTLTTGYGQTVYATSNNKNLTTSQLTRAVDVDPNGVAHINNQTSEQDIIDSIKNEKVSKLIVDSGDVNFTTKIVEAINARTKSLTIELAQYLARLKVQNNIQITQGKLEVLRGAGKSDELMFAPSDNNLTGNFTISGISFRNNLATGYVFSNLNKEVKFTFENNTLFNNGYMSDKDLVSGATTVRNNTLNLGSIATDKAVSIGGDVYIGSDRYVAAVGYMNTTGGVKLDTTGGKSELIVANESGKVVSSGELVLNGSESTGRYNFDGMALRPPTSGNQTTKAGTADKKYNIFIRFYDTNGNQYVRFIGQITEKGQVSPAPPEPTPPTGGDNNNGGNGGNGGTTTPPTGGGSGGTTTPPNGGGGTGGSGITGGGTSGSVGGSSSSGSTGSLSVGNITADDVKKSTLGDTDVKLTIGNTTLANSMKDGKDFKTNYENVTAAYENGKLVFRGLVPEKEYKDLIVTYTDRNSKTVTVNIASFKTKSPTTNLKQFVSDVYKYSLGRLADEPGFAYWESQLRGSLTSPYVFAKNLLNEKEFVDRYKTTSDKMKGLYEVIVNRTADTEGLKFWTNKYEEFVKSGHTSSMALNEVIDDMLGEDEFKGRIGELEIEKPDPSNKK